MATTASLPVFETTDSFMPPLWMYVTLPQASPWEKMVSFLLNSTIFRATPGESRKACASESIAFACCTLLALRRFHSHILQFFAPDGTAAGATLRLCKSLASSSLYWTGASITTQLRPSRSATALRLAPAIPTLLVYLRWKPENVQKSTASPLPDPQDGCVLEFSVSPKSRNALK